MKGMDNMRIRRFCFAVLLTIAVFSGSVAAQNRDQMARAIANSLINGQYERVTAGFDDTMKALLTPSALENAYKQVVKKYGPFKAFIGTKRERVQGTDIVYVQCLHENGAVRVKVVFNSSNKISGLWIEPTANQPKVEPSKIETPPEGLVSREVTIGIGEFALPGTLLLPPGKGPFPAVLLVHGSGPNDRDETIRANRPFRDIAEGLAQKGIAVLRYDKRTKAHALKMKSLASTLTVKEEVLDDAVLAVQLLRTTPEVNPTKIVVLGHSFGGMLAPRIATLDPRIAGIILLAANSRPLEDLLVEQTVRLLSRDGLSEEDRQYVDTVKKQAARVKDPKLSEDTIADLLPLGLAARYWIHLRQYSPIKTVKTLKLPILVLQGERDFHVTMKDFEGWKAALAGAPNASFKTYPSLNHLFIEGKGASYPDEYDKAGKVSQTVIDDIAEWVKKIPSN